MIGFCSSPKFVDHYTGPRHPERANRIRAILQAVRDAGLINSSNPFPDYRIDLGLRPIKGVHLKELPARPADESLAELVHSSRHLRRIRQVCEQEGIVDSGDTPVVAASYGAALLSLGAVIGCCEAVMKGQVRRAFAAVRPPGHHAEPERAQGFCLFSNIAIAARYLQRQWNLKRIAIVDFDVHHGNGTQAVFDDDPNVYFVSLHQHPSTCYPGTGFEWEIGVGPGRGYTMNIPFPPGSTDADYLRVMDNRVLPELEEFRPEVLLVSAGFDAHRDDPLAQIELTEEGFELMTRSLAALADRHCGGRLISVLEGGYNLRALGRSVVRHLLALS